MASGDFAAKAQGFDGFSTYGAGLGHRYEDAGRIRIGAVGAGFDNSAVAEKGKALIRSRMGGETYARDWEAVLDGVEEGLAEALGVELVLLEGVGVQVADGVGDGVEEGEHVLLRCAPAPRNLTVMAAFEAL